MSEKQELVNNRRVDFTNKAERVAYDAKNLMAIAKLKYGKFTVQDVLDLATRQTAQQSTDHIDTPEYIALLRQAIAVQLKGQEPILKVTSGVSTEAIEAAQETNEHGVSTEAIEAAQETNEHGVSMEAITSLVDGFKLAFGEKKEAVLARFNTHLTPEKLRQIQYFQGKGHGIDVPSITEDGEVELASCSEVAPTGHRNMNYFDAEDLLKQPEFAGVDFMTADQAISLIRAGVRLDRNSWSYLKSPNIGTRKSRGRAVYCSTSNVYELFTPFPSNYYGAFRVWLRV
jgi:hypothetical protein